MKFEHDHTQLLPWNNDPKLLLQEISRCLLAQEPVPQAVATWFCDAVAAGKISSKGVLGRPRNLSPEIEKAATAALVRLRENNVTVGDAAKATSKLLGIRLSKQKSQKLLDLSRYISGLQRVEATDHTRILAIREFRLRRSSAMSAEQALHEVANIRDWPERPSLDELKYFQHEEEFGGALFPLQDQSI